MEGEAFCTLTERLSLSTSSQLCLNLVFPVDILKKYSPYPTSHDKEKTIRSIKFLCIIRLAAAAVAAWHKLIMSNPPTRMDNEQI